MKKTFQDGVDAIYNALVAAGTTPGGKTPADLATGISKMFNIDSSNVLFNNGTQGHYVESDYGNSSASTSYTLTKDYDTILLIVISAVAIHNGTSSFVGNPLHMGSPNGNISVTCTKGTVIKKNGYWIIKNAKNGGVINMSTHYRSSGWYHQTGIWGIILA